MNVRRGTFIRDAYINDDMSDGATSFLTFSVFNFASLCLGYTARRRGWVDEECSRPIHFHTVVWIWSAASLLSLWRIPIHVEKPMATRYPTPADGDLCLRIDSNRQGNRL